MPDPTSPLDAALTAACEFARAHDVTAPITPADFVLQRAAPGVTHATYVDSEHVVSVLIDADHGVSMAVGEIGWVHDEADPHREICDCCEVIDTADFIDVYLPGDKPPALVEVGGDG